MVQAQHSHVESHSSQHESEEDPLLRTKKHSKPSDASASTIGVWPHLPTKQVLKLVISAVLLVVIISFVNAVKTQVNDPSGLHTILASNALKRLNHDTAYTPRDKCAVTVLIARHCNNYGAFATDNVERQDKHCSDVGYERARYFATQFAPPDESPPDESFNSRHHHRGSRWPTPVGLFALLPHPEDASDGVNYRQIETLLPLAEQTNVSIQVVGQARHVATSLFRLLQTMPAAANEEPSWNTTLDDTMDDTIVVDHDESAYCGQVFVVAWERTSIPDLAAALGCSPTQGCPGEYPDGAFDLVWQLRFVHPGAVENSARLPWPPLAHLIVDEHHLLSAELRAEQVQDEVDADADGEIYSNFSALEELQMVDQKNHHRQHDKATPGSWTVHGTVSQQDFDPLHVSYMQALNQGNGEL